MPASCVCDSTLCEITLLADVQTVAMCRRADIRIVPTDSVSIGLIRYLKRSASQSKRCQVLPAIPIIIINKHRCFPEQFVSFSGKQAFEQLWSDPRNNCNLLV